MSIATWQSIRDSLDSAMAALVPGYASSSLRSTIKGGLWSAVGQGVASTVVLSVNGTGPDGSGNVVVSTGPVTVRYDFSTSAGWTLDNNSGTSAITSGELQLTITAGTTPNYIGGAYNGPDAFRASDLDPCLCTVYARLGSMPALGALNTGLLFETAGRTVRAGALIAGNGAVYAVNVSSNVNLANTGTGVIDLAGDGWLALRRRGSLMEMCYGNGTGGAVPTTWTVLYIYDISTYTIESISFFARIFSPPGTDSICAWADLYTANEGRVLGG